MKLWLVVFVGLGFGAGVLGFRFLQYAKAPAEARNRDEDTKVVLEGRQMRNPTDEPEGMLKYRGQYMTFMYPATASKYPLKKANESILEQIDFEIDNPRLSIVVAASQAIERDLNEVSGVTLRRSQKDKYREDQVVVGVEKNPVFSTLDNREKTVFVMYNHRLYTLSVYGPDAEEVKALWQKILPTFHFI